MENPFVVVYLDAVGNRLSSLPQTPILSYHQCYVWDPWAEQPKQPVLGGSSWMLFP